MILGKNKLFAAGNLPLNTLLNNSIHEDTIQSELCHGLSLNEVFNFEKKLSGQPATESGFVVEGPGNSTRQINAPVSWARSGHVSQEQLNHQTSKSRNNFFESMLNPSENQVHNSSLQNQPFSNSKLICSKLIQQSEVKSAINTPTHHAEYPSSQTHFVPAFSLSKIPNHQTTHDYSAQQEEYPFSPPKEILGSVIRIDAGPRPSPVLPTKSLPVQKISLLQRSIDTTPKKTSDFTNLYAESNSKRKFQRSQAEPKLYEQSL